MSENLKNQKRASPTLGGTIIPNKRGLAASSIFRAANILICLSNGVNTITDIATQCQLSKSSVHRILKSLEEPQMVVRDSINHRYYLGPLISQLSSNPRTSHELLINTSLPELEQLSQISEETVSIVILTGIRIILLHEIPSKHSLKVTYQSISQYIETRQTVSLGATENILLSQLEDSHLSATLLAIKDENAESLSPEKQQLLLTQLRKVRDEGYSVTFGARIPGVIGISVPVFNYVYPVALSIVGPEGRVLPRLSGLIDELKKSAASISERLSKATYQNR